MDSKKIKTIKNTVKPFKEGSVKPNTDKILISLLRTLNLVPGILFAIVNILKANKSAIVPAMIFIKAFIASDPLKNKSKDIFGHEKKEIDSLDSKAKNFLTNFSQIFLQTYSKTSDIDKIMMALAFIDIIANEIPNIIKEADKAKYIDTPKIFGKLIQNAKEVEKEYNKGEK